MQDGVRSGASFRSFWAPRGGWRRRARTEIKGLWHIIKLYPSTIIWPILVLGLVLGVGVWGVTYVANAATNSSRDRAVTAAMDAAVWLEQYLGSAIAPVMLSAAMVTYNPDFNVVQPLFTGLAPVMLAQAPNNTIRVLQLVPNGVVKASYPLQGNEGAVNLDVFGSDVNRAGAIKTVRDRTLTLAGPLNFVQGGYGVIVRQPIFIQNVSADATFNITFPVNKLCGPPCAYNITTRTKLWGFVSALVELSGLSESDTSRLRSLEEMGYQYELWAMGESPALVAASAVRPENPVEATVNLPNNEWVIRVSPDHGWSNKWYGGLLAGVIVLALATSLLLFTALVSRRRHQMLLEALLPKQLIQDLTTEEAATTLVKDKGRGGFATTGETPADLLLDMMADLLEGGCPRLADVVFIRTALLRNLDLYTPIDLGSQIRGANLDAEVAQALVQQLVGIRQDSIPGLLYPDVSHRPTSPLAGPGQPCDLDTANQREFATLTSALAFLVSPEAAPLPSPNGLAAHCSSKALPAMGAAAANGMNGCKPLAAALPPTVSILAVDRVEGGGGGGGLNAASPIPASAANTGQVPFSSGSLPLPLPLPLMAFRNGGGGGVGVVGANGIGAVTNFVSSGAGGGRRLCTSVAGSLTSLMVVDDDNAEEPAGRPIGGVSPSPWAPASPNVGFMAAGHLHPSQRTLAVSAAAAAAAATPFSNHATSTGSSSGRLAAVVRKLRGVVPVPGSGSGSAPGQASCLGPGHGALGPGAASNQGCIRPDSCTTTFTTISTGTTNAVGAGTVASGVGGGVGGGGVGGHSLPLSPSQGALLQSSAGRPSSRLILSLGHCRSPRGGLGAGAGAAGGGGGDRGDRGYGSAYGGSCHGSSICGAVSGGGGGGGDDLPVSLNCGVGGGIGVAAVSAAAAAAAGGGGGGRSVSGPPPAASGKLQVDLQLSTIEMEDEGEAAAGADGGEAGKIAAGPAVAVAVEVATERPAGPLMEDAERLLSGADSWFFDMWALRDATQGHALSVVSYYLLHRQGIISRFQLKPVVVARLLRHIEAGYMDNPYHNSTHAADVLQVLHVLLHAAQLHVHYLDQLGLFAAYFAAIIHDYGHPGLTGDFLSATSAPLALRYNDRSPLENHHCAAAFTLMARRPELDVLAPLSAAEKAAFRKLVIDLVLATDMKQHVSILSHFTTVHRLAAFTHHQHQHHQPPTPPPAPPPPPPSHTAGLANAFSMSRATATASATSVAAAAAVAAASSMSASQLEGAQPRAPADARAVTIILAAPGNPTAAQQDAGVMPIAAATTTAARDAAASAPAGANGGAVGAGPPDAASTPSMSSSPPRTGTAFGMLVAGAAGDAVTGAAAAAVAAPKPLDETERLLGLQVALKCADIGNLGRELECYKRWVAGLEEEFFRQGDLERQLGIPISPLSDRTKQGVSKSQTGFFDFVALPLVHAMASAFPGGQPLLRNFLDNYNYWKRQPPPADVQQQGQGHGQEQQGPQQGQGQEQESPTHAQQQQLSPPPPPLPQPQQPAPARLASIRRGPSRSASVRR